MIWDTYDDETRIHLRSVQMQREEDMLEFARAAYKESLTSGSRDENPPEQKLLASVREQLHPAYQRWIDEVATMPKTPAWVYPLCAIGSAHMADLTIRVVLTHLLFSRASNTLVRLVEKEEDLFDLPTAQTIAYEIGNWAMKIINFQRAREQNPDAWKWNNIFYKRWHPKRCVAFAKKMSDVHKLTIAQQSDFGHNMLRIAVASGVLRLINHRMYIQGKPRQALYVTLSDDILGYLDDAYATLLDELLPSYRPMLCRPTAHTVDDRGGAISPWLRKKSVKTRTVKTDGQTQPPVSLSSREATILNALQNTEWCINTKVLDVMEEMFKMNHAQAGLPPAEITSRYMENVTAKYPRNGTPAEQREWKKTVHGIEEAWRRSIQMRRKLTARIKEARNLSRMKCFWHAWFEDFRGRKYTATEMLSPQGGDWDRALLMFANPMRQTKLGLYWSKVNVANLFDKDKGLTFDQRVAWVDANLPMLKAIATDPIGNRGLWISDKKKKNPSFQRLAAVYDLLDTIVTGYTRVPPQLDGTCNGAQHWAAIMRDADLAKVVNIVKVKLPGDLYQKVADKATEICKTSPNPWRDVFMNHWGGVIDRGIAKRPTMCDPYGITFYGIRRYCKMDGGLDWLPDESRNAASLELATALDMALSDTLILPNLGKTWLQSVAEIASDMGVQLEWVTPTGFRVWHTYTKKSKRNSFAWLFTTSENNKRTKMVMTSGHSNKLNKASAISSIAPNFTHSVDAAHMTLVLERLIEAGCVDFCFVHDSYGVPAPYVPILRSAIVECFVELHKMDPLSKFKEHMETVLGRSLPDLPARGTLELDQCLDAEYMFQ